LNSHLDMLWFGAILVVAVFALKRLGWISVRRARSLLEQGAVVVDVRTNSEFLTRHVPGALNLPLDSLADAAARRLPDKRKVVLLHCLSGTRSGIAKRLLTSMGYTSVFNLGSLGRARRIVNATQS
jgi:phage shock protein E